MLLILSEPGLLGGDSLTVGPIEPTEPILLKWPPVTNEGPCIIDGTGATDTDGGGVWWLFLPPRLEVVTTALLETDVAIDDIGSCDCGWDAGCDCDCANAGWLLDDPRFGLRTLSLSVDWDLKNNYGLNKSKVKRYKSNPMPKRYKINY